MTGPEHYREAERLLEGPWADDSSVIAIAQVRATLSLAAATAEVGRLTAPMPDPDPPFGTVASAWGEVSA